MLLNISSRYEGGGIEEANDRMSDMADHMNDVAEAGDEAGGSADRAGGGFSRMSSMIMGAVGALGLVAGALAVFSSAVGGVFEMQGAMNLVQAQTGMAGAELEAFGAAAQGIYTSGLGESLGDVTQSMSQVERITGLAGDALAGMSEDALIMRDVFDADVTESVRAADTMMEQFGITGDQAMDLLAHGFQTTGDPAGDLLDTFNEYSGNFAEMGLSAEQALALLSSGLEGGARNTDDVADAMREFQIRMKENPQALHEAFPDNVGDDFFAAMDAGYTDNANALAYALSQLQEIEDPIERNAAGVALFGTKWEDMGEEAFLSMSMANEGLDAVAGTTDEAGAAMQQGLGPAVERLKRTGMTLLTNFLTPYVNEFADRAIPAMENFGEWLESDGVPLLERLGDEFDTARKNVQPLIEDVAQFMANLSPESIMLIGAALAVMVGPAVIAGMASLVTMAGAAALAFAPLAVAMGLVVAYETDFGGLKTAVNDFGAAVRDGDTLGALNAMGRALTAIPKGIAQEIGDLVGIDVSAGLGAWEEFGVQIGTILANFEGLPTAISGMLLEAAGIDPEQAQAFVNEKIISPFATAISQIAGGDIEGGAGTIAGAFGNLIIMALATIGIDADTAQNLITNKIISPITAALSMLISGGGEEGEGNSIVNAVMGFGAQVLAGILEGMPDWVTEIQTNVIDPIIAAAGGLVDQLATAIQQGINAAIPDSVSFRVKIDTPLGNLFDDTVSVPLPDPFAAGGLFDAGQTMLVGERGPEIVQFGSSGRVIPNQLAFAGAANGSRATGADEPVMLQPVILQLDGRTIFESVERVRKARA